MNQLIDQLRTAGSLRDLIRRSNTKFCRNDLVTRGQMATFLVRALEFKDANGCMLTDAVGHNFELAIDRLATAEVTKGCNPPDNTMFCPDDLVTREQMDALLRRVLDV